MDIDACQTLPASIHGSTGIAAAASCTHLQQLLGAVVLVSYDLDEAHPAANGHPGQANWFTAGSIT